MAFENNPYFAATPQMQLTQAKFVTQVFVWMAAALGVTGLTAWLTFLITPLAMLVFNPVMLIILTVSELGLVWYLTRHAENLSISQAKTMLFIYAGINGLTMSVYLYVFTATSVAGVFFITAAVFGTMALYGYKTNKDLTQIGSLCFMALIGLIIATLVNIFLNNTVLDLLISYIGVIIFVGFTAYDAQKLKKRAYYASLNSQQYVRHTVMGALNLYLDFINLFIYLIRILGKRRN